MHLSAASVAVAFLAAPAASLSLLGISIPDGLFTGAWYGAPENDFKCVDAAGRNPVVLFHALGASREVDLNLLHQNLTREGWCVYAKTYGAPIQPPLLGGLINMTESAKEVGDFILEVARKTERKVDLVCHSEGGSHCLYVPMTQPNVAAVVEHTIALAPAVHGAHYLGAADFYQALPFPFPQLIKTAIGAVCAACIDLETRDGAIYRAFESSPKIVPSNIKATIIMSNYDTLVAPKTSRIQEPNVRNLLLQDYCPNDHSGHFNLAWTQSVWNIVKNELEEVDRPVVCDTGGPL
ncbi:hypothetical protein NLG97_g4133 [Lecanicillium saksenae]|uniref:Uncharacterized protein n=1 Tax=Lecanicillium saksenae TaxID=468837 RepID=A0ACC1QZB6_9HYPO|nr:hypothetical protein NLG97_g4133 [Lecanicillium saksenae]